jgi:acetone carboxylase gamma subunit
MLLWIGLVAGIDVSSNRSSPMSPMSRRLFTDTILQMLIGQGDFGLHPTISSQRWCWRCVQAPHRWGWLLEQCQCDDGWTGACCDEWSVADWKEKVADWNRGRSCEEPQSHCRRISQPPIPISHQNNWTYQPSIYGRTTCIKKGCIWVKCLSSDSSFSNVGPSEMCPQCSGPWTGKCKFHSYSPSILAFAGPGDHCGYKYPICPDDAAENCFCGHAKTQFMKEWDRGTGLNNFCLDTYEYGDGRRQPCAWSGYTFTPQEGGFI